MTPATPDIPIASIHYQDLLSVPENLKGQIEFDAPNMALFPSSVVNDDQPSYSTTNFSAQKTEIVTDQMIPGTEPMQEEEKAKRGKETGLYSNSDGHYSQEQNEEKGKKRPACDEPKQYPTPNSIGNLMTG